MQLIRNGRFVGDPWKTVTNPEAEQDLEGCIVPGQWLIDRIGFGEPCNNVPRHGVVIENSMSLDAAKVLARCAALIVIRFPAATDGRGFSLARYLRAQAYQGELRASGPLIVDQYPLVRASGFETVEIPNEIAARQPEISWRRALAAYPRRYQPSHTGAPAILQLRRQEAATGTNDKNL